MTSLRGAIVVFAKAPRPGLVKTRLSPPFSMEQAAAFYGELLADVLQTTAETAGSLGLEPVLAVHPPESAHELRSRTPREFRIVAQRGPDLATRMSFAAAEAAAGGMRRILIRGSDCPTLDGDSVAAVLGRLESRDIVLCPDQEGGYTLVGLRRFAGGLFDHAMSTPSVLDDTLANAARLGLRADVVGRSFDVDTAADLALLAAARQAGQATGCPRTLAWLDENAMWPAEPGGTRS